MTAPDLTPQTPGALPAATASKLEDLAALTVADMADELPKLDDDELVALAGIETRGKARASALAAIASEQAKRAADAAVPATGDHAPKVPNVTGDPESYADRPGTDVDPGKLTKPVLTRDGWVMPGPSAIPER